MKFLRFVLLALLGCVVIRGIKAAQDVIPKKSTTSFHTDELLEREIPELSALYQKLHAAPELSHFEVKTSAVLTAELRKSGFTVVEGLGKFQRPEWRGYGVAAVLENGPGPVVLVRAELDALPVRELTGLSYASTVRTKNDDGQEVGVAHACGHDLHLTSMVGLARILARDKSSWRGTVVLIGEPAEETGDGPRALLADNLYEKIPPPDYILALHGIGDLEAGKVGIVSGQAMQTSQTVEIIVPGVGGHSSRPHEAKDPVVLAAQIVLGLQTIVSRESPPGDSSVITVGVIQGGTKANVIPDQVRLMINIRATSDATRQRNIRAIERIAVGMAEAAGMPPDRKPRVSASETEVAAAVFNDPKLVERLSAVFASSLSADRVVQLRQRPGADTLAAYNPVAGRNVPVMLIFLGVADPAKVMESRRTGVALPATHSPHYAPVFEPALRTGITVMSAAVRNLLRPGG